MSALNVCMGLKRCVVMQDAAVYTLDGEVVRFREKGSIIEAKRMFVGSTGASEADRAYALLIDELFDDIDQVAFEGEEPFDNFYQGLVAAEKIGDHGLCLIVAGWSSTLGRPRCVKYTQGQPGRPRTFMPDLGTLTHPTLEGRFAEDWKRYHGMDEINVHRFDPLADGLHLMEIQRRQPIPISGGRQVYAVGGHVDLTEVSEAGVSRRVVRTWSEDRPGRRIVPGPMPDVPANVTAIAPAVAARDGLNRAARRRLDKKQRSRVA